MKKMFKLFSVLFVALMLAVPAMATNYDYIAEVYSFDGSRNVGTNELTRVESGITFQVLTVNTDTIATLTEYNDGTSTSLTNPVTTTNFASATVCNKNVQFRTTASTVDLIVVDTAGGYTAFVEGFSPNDRKIIIDETPNIQHHGCIFVSSSTAETDTGIDFDYDTVISDVRLEVVTVDAGETLDVGILSSGTNGDADGLLDGVSVAVAGYIADTAVITHGTNADYWTVSTYGALLATAITGADTDVTTLGGRTMLEGHYVISANEQSLTHTGSAGSDTFVGYIHYFFTRLR